MKKPKVLIVTEVCDDEQWNGEEWQQKTPICARVYDRLERAIKPFREKIDIRVDELKGFWSSLRKLSEEWPEGKEWDRGEAGLRALKTLFIDYDAVLCFKKPTEELFDIMGFSNFGKLPNQDYPRIDWPELEVHVFHQMNSVLSDRQPIKQWCYDPKMPKHGPYINPVYKSIEEDIEEGSSNWNDNYTESVEAYGSEQVNEYLESLMKIDIRKLESEIYKIKKLAFKVALDRFRSGTLPVPSYK